LTVTWAVYPRSFWRKLLLARVRRPILSDEVKASLAGLDTYLRTTAPEDVAMTLRVTRSQSRRDDSR
jgi:hypothetical protein